MCVEVVPVGCLHAVRQAIAAESDGIEHCSCLTESGPNVADDALARQQVVVCPTLGHAAGVPPSPALAAMLQRAGLTPEEAVRARAAGLERLHRNGVVLVSGSDAGIGPGKPLGVLARAVAALLDSGIPPVHALASATSIAARHSGLAERKVRLHPGYDADLLVVDGDPLTDITALERVIAVMVGGRWIGRVASAD